MSLLLEYIGKNLTNVQLEAELTQLIKNYNEQTGRYLMVYAAAIAKQVPAISLNMDDYYIIYDLLRSSAGKKLDFYIETPGGSGEAAEEIVRFLRDNFPEVSFIVSGEAKSAGTIMVMSSDEIKMTDSGSLGPIDAQMIIGRSPMSAYDYMEWIDEKREEAEKKGKLNPFDATMIAQITPGELNGVNNALNFAKDIVAEWLVQYKFKNWKLTETKKEKVTPERKLKRAKEIVDQLVNHSKWRSHGRSLKREDLEKLGLKITRIDDNKLQADIVYRIQTVLKLIFVNSNAYKYIATQDGKIASNAIPAKPVNVVPTEADSLAFEFICQKCNKKHKLYAKLESNGAIDEHYKKQGHKKFPANNKLVCDCGFEHDLLPFRNDMEKQSGRKLVD